MYNNKNYTKTKENIAKIISIVVAITITVVFITITANNRNIAQIYINYIKTALAVVWYISYIIHYSYDLRQFTSKAGAIVLNVIYSVFYVIQLIGLFNVFNYIEIQHYFLWRYDISFLEIAYKNIEYDFLSGKFGYLLLQMLMFTTCLLIAFAKIKVNNYVGNTTSEISHKTQKIDEVKTHEVEKDIIKPDFRQNPSSAKLRSRKRAEDRRNKATKN